MPPLPEAAWTGHKEVLFWTLGVPLLVAVFVLAGPVMLLAHLWFEPRWRRHKARLLADRLGDSICTFARSFDRRATDPWVIRAVWDEMQDLLGAQDRPFPIRSGDRWSDDLDDALVRVCRRSGHSLAYPERNPWYGRVEAVGDLVRFANAQPRTEAGYARTMGNASQRVV